MSEVIWISTETPAQPIADRLGRETAFLKSAGICLETEITRSRLLQFVGCQVGYDQILLSEAEGRSLCRQYIANVLTDVLVDEWQPLLLQRLLKRRHSFLTAEEQAEIVEQASWQMAEAATKAPLYQASQKSRVREALVQYLANHHTVNLEGFFNFRLRFYQQELSSVLQQVVDQHLGERADGEFVRLLQSFLQVLDPKYDVVHLLLTNQAEFAVLDEQGELLRQDVLETTVAGENGAPEEYEDVLISALLSIAPRQLVVHAGTFREAPGLLTTLQRIWQKRLVTCTDCDLCARLLRAEQKDHD